MLPARSRSLIHAIAVDRKSGAIELAVKVVDAFEELSGSISPPSANEINTVVKFLSKAQPSMVPIHNTAEICSRILAHGGDVAAELTLLRTFLEESREKVATNSLKVFNSSSVIVTLSRSSTVLAALRLAAASGKLQRVFVMESRPRFEGRVTAREMMILGVDCVLVADAAGPSLLSEADMAVVGADAILRDGAVVNKIGTYPLSLACSESGKPLYVLTEAIKVDRRFSSRDWPDSELRDEKELLPSPPRGLRALNRYFDLSPSANVTAVVHEKGVSRRGWFGEMEKVLAGLLTESP